MLDLIRKDRLQHPHPLSSSHHTRSTHPKHWRTKHFATLPLLSATLAISSAAAFGVYAQTNQAAQASQTPTPQQATQTPLQTPQRPAAPHAQPSHLSDSQKLLHTLAAPLHQVRLKQTTLRQALTWWSKTTEIPLVLDWEDIQLSGVDPQTRIDLEVDGLSAGHTLILILESASPPGLTGADPDAKLFAEVHKRYITCLTRGQANRQAYTVVYDVAAEALPVYDHFNTAPNFDLQQVGQQQGGTGGSGAQNIFNTQTQNTLEDRRQARLESGEAIAEYVRQTVEPRLWLQNGGNVATVRYFRNRLIVRAPSYAHDQIPFRAIHSAKNNRQY